MSETVSRIQDILGNRKDSSKEPQNCTVCITSYMYGLTNQNNSGKMTFLWQRLTHESSCSVFLHLSSNAPSTLSDPEQYIVYSRN